MGGPNDVTEQRKTLLAALNAVLDPIEPGSIRTIA